MGASQHKTARAKLLGEAYNIVATLDVPWPLPMAIRYNGRVFLYYAQTMLTTSPFFPTTEHSFREVPVFEATPDENDITGSVK